MLTGPRSGKLLARLLADPDSFTGPERKLADLVENAAGTPDYVPTDQEWAALSNTTRFYVAVCSLKLTLAQQRNVIEFN